MRTLDYLALTGECTIAKLSANAERKQRWQRRISKRMSKMHGLPQKIGQMFSMQTGLDVDGPFDQLRQSSDAMPHDTVLSILKQSGRFNDGLKLDVESHAASIGQVHRGQLADGQTVAIKVQYPQANQFVNSDLNHLELVGGAVDNFKNGFDFSQYHKLFKDKLETELDYRTEAKIQRSFFDFFGDDPRIVVPEPYSDRSTDTVLVSAWEDGCRVEDVIQWPLHTKQKLSEALLHFFFCGVFSFGKMQADWHPGNFSFRQLGDRVQIVVYDFGCICQLDENQRQALAQLIRCAITGNGPFLQLFLELGFKKDLMLPISRKLAELSRILFAPFCQSAPFDLEDWEIKSKINQLLGDDRWNLRLAGPPELLFLLRAFHGLCFYLNAWNTPVSWADIFNETVPQRKTSHPMVTSTQSKFPARCLKINVSEFGQTKVQISQPATALENLENALDITLLERISDRGIQLKELAATAKRDGFPAGELFSLETDEKKIKVWLE